MKTLETEKMSETTEQNETTRQQVPHERVVSHADYRRLHAKSARQIGRRAYSDELNHVLVTMHGGVEYGMDLACAICLREDLDRAIGNAALPDDEYLNLCG